MTRFKAKLGSWPKEQLTGQPDSAYAVYRRDGFAVGIVSRKRRRWVAWGLDGRWWLVGTRAEAVRKLGGQL